MTVVAIVPAKDRQDSVGQTVAALRGVHAVDEVVVVDDGSTDATSSVAAAAGATVVRLPVNVGKGAAVAAGVKEFSAADVYLLIDADVGGTAALADALLAPVLAGDADLTIAVLPSAGGKGGFGTIRRLAAAGVERATKAALRPRAPLSGQRAVRGPLLRSLPGAHRFGLETAMTIDAVAAGARVLEVDVAMDHRHTGRRLSGFRHRAGQGVDIVRALWPRVTTARARRTGLVAFAVVGLVAMLWSGQQWQPSSVGLDAEPRRVVVFGLPHVTFDDVESGRMPHLARLIDDGAVGAMSVRTVSGQPSSVEAYATLGAGVRVEADPLAALALDGDERVGTSSAAETVARLQGEDEPDGDVVVLAGAVLRRENEKHRLSSEPGALGEALRAAGLETAVVGNADTPGSLDPEAAARSRPVAVALMDDRASVAGGTVDASRLLVEDAAAPFGRRADAAKVLDETLDALTTASVVVVDPGDLDRAAAAAPFAADGAAAADRDRAVRATDAILGQVRDAIDDDTLLLALAVTPETSAWALTPAAVAGPGVPKGRLVSPSTKREGVVVITDVATTILAALGVEPPAGMVGQAWRYRPSEGHADLASLRELEDQTAFREFVYRPATTIYVVVQVLLHLFAIFAMSRRGGPGRYGGALRLLLLAAAAFPLACFVFRAVPGSHRLGAAAIPALALLSAAIAAFVRRFDRHPLQPLTIIMAATVAVLVLDVATGSRLHVSNVLGYSLQSAGRFYGFPNTTFGVLTACALLLAAAHVHYSPDRRAALVRAAVLLAVVVVVDGAPGLGDDVGGVIALVPIAGLTLLAMSGVRFSVRRVLLAGLATAAALALVAATDLMRAPDQQAHIGRFFTSLADGGPSVILETIERKEAANFRILSKSVWTWVIPAGASLMLYLLVWERRFVPLVPRGSALRIGVISTVVASLVGFAVNDSGPVVTALFFVFLGPFLVLLALHQEHGEVTVIRPGPAGPDVVAVERQRVSP